MPDVIDLGRGPVLVFLHGAGVDNRLWEPQVRAFGQTHRVIVPNLPGHGGLPLVRNVPQMAAHVRALLTARGISRYAVIGLSLGGMVALEMAGRWPEEVTHLAMIESVANVTDRPVALALMSAALCAVRLVPPALFSLLPARQLGAYSAQSAAYLRQTLPKGTGRNTYHILQAALRYDGRPHLSALAMPTLVLVGEKNTATHHRARQMADQIEHCRFSVLPNAGHIANLDAPECVTAHLRSLLLLPD